MSVNVSMAVVLSWLCVCVCACLFIFLLVYFVFSQELSQAPCKQMIKDRAITEQNEKNAFRRNDCRIIFVSTFIIKTYINTQRPIFCLSMSFSLFSWPNGCLSDSHSQHIALSWSFCVFLILIRLTFHSTVVCNFTELGSIEHLNVLGKTQQIDMDI